MTYKGTIIEESLLDNRIIDKSSWNDAISYGLSLGIPAEQLDFLIVE